ncbi:hypothetical protein Poli38472_011761 [Pythium oligandrum]|uniref:Cyclic nucleotide-binding domain-containing protein n=1 Tax=Pythium oligandrum TaxID=41045 RepID=A0A8K1C851_PYTOL|nr:hypothetical protein Poli38472_011761 [Pythium oligandrum]|eukprot:TMW58173.1 hypothetical protein Poli38472_011761 [Pythium oligandrum]
MACFWKLLQPAKTESSSTTDAIQAYVSHFYDVLQLLQGQGIETKSIEQNIFAALLVLIGSIALATVFGHVAMLVSNFNANTTSYQRKMESTFATMNKLQLPAPLRERIRQYYEHLWREYESLDGEIVRFSKELSHTLELEVVLFKYMDLVMHVPFWGDASPDFQKQLMLHLDVRVYLPDDFIIRRGEVGDEFYMINRGIFMVVTCSFHVIYFPLRAAFFPDRHESVSARRLGIVVECLFLLDFLWMFNTAFLDKHGQLVTSRHAIYKRYLRSWLIPDLLASIPVDIVLEIEHQQQIPQRWEMLDELIQIQRLVHMCRAARFTWIHRLHNGHLGRFSRFVFSRYTHLARILSIVIGIIFFTHCIACGWKLLDDAPSSHIQHLGSAYASSFYIALQLLQGQGVPTRSIHQNVFAALLVLIGSIALATVFGHVAMLVSNFNANTTSYQRKMESTFATMNKLQLPAPLRERIRQYYEHLWREYESLDGEIVRFSKELSHTLELEVVLFKYMDLVMHVPFWGDASPDFQKQLMLRLDVRVYLPDDFIIRRGEVGDEFYMINRGICELELGPDSLESTIEPLGDDTNAESTSQAKRSTWSSGRFLVGNGEKKSKDSSLRLQVLRHGQTVGELALLMNYERSVNARAITHVELCVLKRSSFQLVLVQHPSDRHRVITHLLTHVMQTDSQNDVVEALKTEVAAVFQCEEQRDNELLSGTHAALLLSNAINRHHRVDDSIRVGIQGTLTDQLTALRKRMEAPRPSVVTPKAISPSSSAATRELLREPMTSVVNNQQKLEDALTALQQQFREARQTSLRIKQTLHHALALYEQEKPLHHAVGSSSPLTDQLFQQKAPDYRQIHR